MTWYLIWSIIFLVCAYLIIPDSIKTLKRRKLNQDLVINGIRISSNTHANAILDLVLGIFGLTAAVVFLLLWLNII